MLRALGPAPEQRPATMAEVVRQLEASLGELRAGGLDEPLVGQTLGGRFRVLRRIGEEKLGTLFEAVHEPLGQKVVVKVLPDALRGSPSVVARFLNEANAASRIDADHAR